MKLSILVPVYNERTVVERSLSQVLAAPLPENIERELIIVDDCSTDGTSAILQRIAAAEPRIQLIRHPVNRGKGAAVRTAIGYASGDFTLVQDADLEYDPQEYGKLLKPLLEGHADAVFGSRYLRGEQSRVLPFWHSMINQFLTLVSNMFCNLHITDMETCYKVFRTDLLKSIPVRSDRFGFEPEITMKAAKRKLRIYEVPISYHGRTYEEGKKIGWKDGVKVFGVLLRYWLIDDLYVEPYGRGALNNITGTPQYVEWLASLLRPHVRDTVLELGAGIGNMTGRLMGRRFSYVAAESDALYLHALRNRFLRTPNVAVKRLNPDTEEDFVGMEGAVETVLCLNVLEYSDDPGALLRRVRRALMPGGTVLVLVPQMRSLMGTLDRTFGYKRRFEKNGLISMLTDQGFTVVQTHDVNKMAVPAWFFYGKVRKSRHIGKLTLKLFDKTVWFWRLVEKLLPWPGLSLIAVATSNERGASRSAAQTEKKAALHYS